MRFLVEKTFVPCLSCDHSDLYIDGTLSSNIVVAISRASASSESQAPNVSRLPLSLAPTVPAQQLAFYSSSEEVVHFQAVEVYHRPRPTEARTQTDPRGGAASASAGTRIRPRLRYLWVIDAPCRKSGNRTPASVPTHAHEVLVALRGRLCSTNFGEARCRSPRATRN